MSDSGRFQPRKNGEDPRELAELSAAIAALPIEDQRLLDAREGVVELIERRRRILSLVQEALAQLRLDVKYLMFDLEVTRRERDELQARLEESERGY